MPPSQGKFAVARLIYRKKGMPRFVALLPQVRLARLGFAWLGWAWLLAWRRRGLSEGVA